MATVFKLKVRQATVAGIPLVVDLTDVTLPNELQIICISGDPIEITGSSGEILGLPVTPLLVYPGQDYRFTEQQYEKAQITIPIGTMYEFSANE